LPLDVQGSFARAATQGRNGTGVIFVFSAGNARNLGVDVNSDGFVNTRFTIAVGAVGKDRKHASYSSTGAAVFVTAPGGDYDSVSGNIVAKPGGGCHDISGKFIAFHALV
jgi:kexin